jgi:hypothetical protein
MPIVNCTRFVLLEAAITKIPIKKKRFGLFNRPKASLLIDLGLVLLGIVFHPVLLVIVAAYLQSVKKLTMNFYSYFFVAFIFVGLWSRNYGIYFSEQAGDDVPEYFRRVKTPPFESLSGIYRTFLDWPSGGEPLFYILNLPVSGIWTGIEEFALYNYFILGVLLAVGIKTLFRHHTIAVSLFLFFISSEILYAFAHIWRQALALTLILISVGALNQSKNLFAFLLLVVATMAHLAALVILITYCLNEVLFRLVNKPNLGLSYILLLLSSGIVILAAPLLPFMPLQNLSFVLANSEIFKFCALIVGTTALTIITWYSSAPKKISGFLFYACFACLIISIVYSNHLHRFLFFIIPLATLILFFVLQRFPRAEFLYFLTVPVSLIGFFRMQFFSVGSLQQAYHGNFFSIINPMLKQVVVFLGF